MSARDRIHEDDAQVFFDAVMVSRERLRRWDDWPDKCQTLEDARAWLRTDMAEWLLRQRFQMGIWDCSQQHLLGGIGLRPHDWKVPFFEIGYWLHTSAEGQGYMSEALQLLLDYTFEHLKARRVMLRIDERNTRSIALAERSSFRREGTLRNYEMATDGTLRNMVIFALTDEDRQPL